MNTVKKYPLPHSPFFLASCGCVGLDVGGERWTAIIRCDNVDGDSIGVDVEHRVYSPEKTYTPLDAEATKALLENLGYLVGGGYALDKVRWFVGGKRFDLPWLISVECKVNLDGTTDYGQHVIRVYNNRDNLPE